MREGLSAKELAEIVRILRQFPDVEEAVLFGSRAMGNFKPGSDVDLALKGPVDFSTVSRVKGLLDEETFMPYFFDVVGYDGIHTPEFKSHIDRFGLTIYRKKN